MQSKTEKITTYLFLSFFGFVVLFPFLWIEMMAFKKQIDIIMMRIIFKPTFFNFDIRSPIEMVLIKYDANAHMADRMMRFKFSMLLPRILMILLKRYHTLTKTINVPDN